MDKKTRLLFVTMLILIALLVFGALWLSQKVVSLENSTNNIAVQLKNIRLPVAINGQDGKDGEQGITGKSGVDGKDGQNAVSVFNTETFYIDRPTNGIDGQQGPAGPTQDIRINPDTKDLETKPSDSSFWQVLVPCSELLRSCPDGSGL